MKPLALDLCCGLGGWAEGLIAAGWDVWGLDIDGRFEESYPGTFWREDVCLVTGQAVRDAMWMSCARQTLGLVVASPPCQEFSRHDQPWTRKRNPPTPDTSIWEACVRIAAECGAPLIVENVRGAQPFMGKAKWHCGPFYLWGDVPALMPTTIRYRKKESRSSSAVAERAKVPFEIAYHIGRVFHPGDALASATAPEAALLLR